MHPHLVNVQLLLFSAVALTVLLATESAAQELPPEIQVDRLLVQAEREIEDGERWSAVATFERILAVCEEHGLEIPVEFWFRQAGVLQGAGLHERAVEAASRYLQQAGREGERYRAALEILDAAEVGLAEARRAEARARAEERRRQDLDRLETTLQGLVRQLPLQGPREDLDTGEPYVATTTRFAIQLSGCRLIMEIVREWRPPSTGNFIRGWTRVDAELGRHNRLTASVQDSMLFLGFEDRQSVTFGSNQMDGTATTTLVRIDVEASATATTELLGAFNRVDSLCMRAPSG